MNKCLPTASIAIERLLHGCLFQAICIPTLLCATATICNSQAHDFVCSDGFGSFNAKSITGVTLSVSAAKNGAFSQRTCRAELAWGTEHKEIEASAREVDVDLMGADLGLSSPVATLQVKNDGDAEMQYEIYSLTKPPKKLRTIAGGDYFHAADTNLDGRIEIWTGDARALEGFEGKLSSLFDFAPTVVLRFDKKRLMDVSAEFQPQYDRQIAMLRAQLDPRQLSDFKNSDGKISGLGNLSVDEFHALRRTKVLVLEIVWSYLYSGREQEAWRVLADLWPAEDMERIREAMTTAREHGIRTQIDAFSSETKPVHSKKHVLIFDEAPAAGEDQATNSGSNLSQAHEAALNSDSAKHSFPAADTHPEVIQMTRPPAPEGQPDTGKTAVQVSLVVDSAGKVWSAKMNGKPDKELLEATANWKFVPAFKGGRPVASRETLFVSTRQ